MYCVVLVEHIVTELCSYDRNETEIMVYSNYSFDYSFLEISRLAVQNNSTFSLESSDLVTDATLSTLD